MGRKDLQCLFIGERSKVYYDLLGMLEEFDLKFQVKLVGADKKRISRALKKIRTSSLIFISDEVPFSVAVLSDLVYQFASDAIVVIVTKKTASTSLKIPFSKTQFSKLHFSKENPASRLHLLYLIEIIQTKWEHRFCKRLLGVSEKRCQWLVDSSNEPIAFISRELHLYANTAYLGLFSIDSIHSLPAISVKELIVDDEHDIFDKFIKKQTYQQKMNRSLVLSLKKTNGKIFRANIHAIPSVLKGRKCMQLWIHPLNKFEFNQIGNNQEAEDGDSKLDIEKDNTDKALGQKKATPASILMEIIKKKEAIISAQKLVDMKPNENKHKKTSANHILSLKLPLERRTVIDELLSEPNVIDSEENRQVFWDKVMITRLFQILINKRSLNVNLFIRLDEASLTDQFFVDWLKHGLNRIGGKASYLNFLLPSELSQNEAPSLIKFVTMLRKANCKIALDDFSVSSRALSLLKHLKPEYVRLSLAWVKQIEGNNDRELALGSFIRQIEEKNIKIIAPCALSADMQKLFSLSGVSFCQERALKSA